MSRYCSDGGNLEAQRPHQMGSSCNPGGKIASAGCLLAPSSGRGDADAREAASPAVLRRILPFASTPLSCLDASEGDASSPDASSSSSSSQSSSPSSLLRDSEKKESSASTPPGAPALVAPSSPVDGGVPIETPRKHAF